MSDPVYQIAAAWNTCNDDDRAMLRAVIERIVGYPCKIAAMDPEPEGVNLVIFSIQAGRVKDYLDIQPSGAIGVAFDLYDDGVSDSALDRLNDACNTYNDELGVEFVSDSESDE